MAKKTASTTGAIGTGAIGTGAIGTGASTAIGTGATMSDSQRMAGDVWRTYDPASQGGAGFEREDYKYLRGQDWSNADIFKAAAKSGNIDGVADQKLRNMGRDMTYRDLPKDAQDYMFKATRGNSGGLTFNFQGGDRNDGRNYRISNHTDYSKSTPEEAAYGMISQAQIMGLNKKAAEKNGGQVWQWNGINADGTANAPTSWKETQGKSGPDRKNYTWRLPDDLVHPTTPGTDSGGGTTTPAPSTPSFNLSDYLSGGSSSSSSSSSSENDSLMPRQFQASIKPSMYESWSTNQSQQPSSPSYSSSYTPRNLTTSSSSSSSSSSSGSLDTGSRNWRDFWNPSASNSSSSSSSASSSTETDDSPRQTLAPNRLPGHREPQLARFPDPEGDNWRGNVAQATFRQLADEFRTRYQRPRDSNSIPSTQNRA